MLYEPLTTLVQIGIGVTVLAIMNPADSFTVEGTVWIWTLEFACQSGKMGTKPLV